MDCVECVADLRLGNERCRERADEQHPSAAHRDFWGGAEGDEPSREEERAEPACRRNAGHEPETADLALACLAQELEPQRAIRTRALSLQLLAFELEATGVAIEGFLQRGDDDAGEPCLEMTERAAARGELRRFQ